MQHLLFRLFICYLICLIFCISFQITQLVGLLSIFHTPYTFKKPDLHTQLALTKQHLELSF